MKIGIFHGYKLTGTGSNEYTRYLARALSYGGHQVHIMCREPLPESISFIDKAIHWDREGRPQTLFERKIDKAGTCILHQLPHASINPVYLNDKPRKGNVKTFIALTDTELNDYHELVVGSLIAVLKVNPVDLLHANHLVYQPVAAAEACRVTGTPLVIVPHGSSIEYTIRKDKRYRNLALDAILASKGLIIGNQEVRDRILGFFPQHRREILAKTEIVGVGVDTSLFLPVNRWHRWDSIENIFKFGPFRGKSPELTRQLYRCLDSGDIAATTGYRKAYKNDCPDSDLIEHLKRIPWDGKIILFVGTLTVGKGLQSLLVAMPFILTNHPDAHLVIVGSGTYREILEGLVYAMSSGIGALLDELIEKGNELDQNKLTGLWKDVNKFLSDPQNKRKLLSFGQSLAEHIHFLGHLNHALLRHLFPCADLAIFPSVIPEAYPLVLMESLSNGVLPLVSYFSGFADSLDSLIPYLGQKLVDRMKIPMDDSIRIPGMIRNISDLIADESIQTIGPVLRKIAVENFDWNVRAKQMVAAYSKIIS